MTHLTITSKGLPFLEEKIPGFTPDLSRSRIQDKSKGSMLAKSLVCIQGRYITVPSLLSQAHMPFSYLVLYTVPFSRDTGISYQPA